MTNKYSLKSTASTFFSESTHQFSPTASTDLGVEVTLEFVTAVLEVKTGDFLDRQPGRHEGNTEGQATINKHHVK